MDNLEIRAMEQQDIEEIIAIENEAFGSPWSQNSFMKELDNPYAYYLVGLLDGVLASYIGAWLIFDEAHITTLAVTRQHRRKGLAGIILSKLLNDAQENGIMKATLEVRESNYAAQKLYKKKSFVDVGRRKKYYSDNQEDAIIMWKEL